MRYAGLAAGLQALGHSVRDAGDLQLAHVPAGRAEPEPRLRHLAEVLAMSRAVAERTAASVARGSLPLVLGGDHSVALGAICGAARSQTLGVLWVDAHGDFNTAQSSPSGNIHGMPVAVLTGRGHPALTELGHPGLKVRPQEIVMIGIRDLDSAERQALVQSGIKIFTMREIDELGMATVARQALNYLHHTGRIHLSFDMDALDPTIAAGVGTPVPGGLTFREAHLLMEILAESTKVRSVDVVEINPILDQGNRTAELAVALLASLLGQRIL